MYGDIDIYNNTFIGNAYSAICFSGTNRFDNVMISKNSILDNGAEGIYIGKDNTANYLTIEGNLIKSTGSNTFGWNGEGYKTSFNGDAIDVKEGNSTVLIKNNEIRNINGMYGISSKSSNTTIEYNYISNIYLEGSEQVTGILADAQELEGSFIIRNNYINTDKSHGIVVRGMRNTNVNVEIYNNTVTVGKEAPYTSIGFLSLNNKNISTYDNNFSGGYYGLRIVGEIPVNVSIKNNYFSNAKIPFSIASNTLNNITIEHNSLCSDEYEGNYSHLQVGNTQVDNFDDFNRLSANISGNYCFR